MAPPDDPPAAIPPPLKDLFPASLAERLLSLRRHLHRFPELSRQEEATATRLSEELEALDPVGVERVAGTGLVARIAGRDRAAPTVALRGDIDALPISEATGLDYASRHSGVIHACGHDVHATWTVGAAALLTADRAAGDVLVVLQPAEETAWGANAVLASGLLDGVEAIFGAHVDRRFAVGEAVIEEGPMNAASDAFRIELRGEGAHGARPHEARDPVIGAAALIMQLQTLVSRRLDPGSPGVVSIGRVCAGMAGNVIPETAELLGTLRATTSQDRDRLKGWLGEMVHSVAAVHRLDGQVEFLDHTPPIVNRRRATEWVRKPAVELLGAEKLRTLPEVNMGGEDFAFYLEKIPGCFFRVGAREPGGEVIAAHSPRFYAADGAIYAGAALLAAAVRQASADLSTGT